MMMTITQTNEQHNDMRLSDALNRYWLEKDVSLSANTKKEYTLTFSRLQTHLCDPPFTAIAADDLRGI